MPQTVSFARGLGSKLSPRPGRDDRYGAISNQSTSTSKSPVDGLGSP